MGIYRDLEKRRAYMRAYQKKKYAEDPIHREKAKAEAKARMKERYANDPVFRAKVIAKARESALRNAEKVSAYQKAYKEANKEHITELGRARYRERYANDPEYREHYKATRRADSKTPKHKARMKGYRAMRRATDPNFKIADNCRRRVLQALRGKDKAGSTLTLIGCTVEQLKAHLEKLWTEGMSWDNYSYRGWHIDHIKPCDAFDLTDPTQQAVCFHYTNLQPLWQVVNQSKGAKFVSDGADVI